MHFSLLTRDGLVLHIPADGARRTGGHRGRDFTEVRDTGIVRLGDRPMDAEDGDVGAVDGAAHVQAAGQGDPHMVGQLHRHEILVDLFHQRLDGARGVRRRRVAVHPPLGVDDIRYGVSDPADRVFLLGQLRQQRGYFRLVLEEELDVVAARETQIAVAVLLGDIADLPDVVRRKQPRRSRAHRVERLSRFADVHHHTGLEDFVIAPLPVIALNHGREHGLIVRGSDIGWHITSPPFSGYLRARRRHRDLSWGP